MAAADDAAVISTIVDELLRSLADTPRQIESTTGGLDVAHLHDRPSEHSWSANDILAHLRACADVWGGSILAMIERDDPTLRYVSPRTWIRKTDYPEQRFGPSFQTYSTQRDDLLRMLRMLAVADWTRGATFTRTTRGREQTILSYARRIVEHEREHLAQIEATVRARESGRDR